MAAISHDLRRRIFDARQEGETTSEVAERFAVSPAFVRRLMQRHREVGNIDAKSGPRGPKRKLAADADRIRQLLTETPDLTVAEVRQRLALTTVCMLTVWRAIRLLDMTFKKKSIHAAERERKDVQTMRLIWPEIITMHAPKRLIFLDETWFVTNMTRLFGFAPRGQRLHASVPHGHYKKITFVGGLTTQGIIAPKVFDGSLNADIFSDYIEKVLAPVTRPGDLLIMDNLSAHKTTLVRATLEKHKIAYQCLPPYSPDLNPIENAFSKLKHLARKAAERTIDGLTKLIHRLIGDIRPVDCINYFKNCGYPATKSSNPL